MIPSSPLFEELNLIFKRVVNTYPVSWSNHITLFFKTLSCCFTGTGFTSLQKQITKPLLGILPQRQEINIRTYFASNEIKK